MALSAAPGAAMNFARQVPQLPAEDRPHVIVPPPRLRRRRNRLLMTLLTLLAIGVVGAFAYKWWTRPTTVTVAVSESNPEDVKVMSAFARVFASGRRSVILKVQTVKSSAEAVAAFRANTVDMVVARADADLRGGANVIAVLRKNYGIVISLDPKIDEIAKIKGKRVGVMGPPGLNDAFVDALLKAYDLTPSDITRVPLEGPQSLSVIERKGVDVLLGVSSIAIGRSAEALRGALRARGKIRMTFLPIDRAADVSRANPAFDEEDLEKGAFAGLPPESIATVSIGANIVARTRMSNEVAAALARQFLSNRQAVIAEAPAAAQIEAPSVEADAFMRAHQGVVNYVNNEEQTFFDKYGDLVYILMAVGGVFGSAAVALRRSIGPDREADACELVDDLVDLRRSVRAAIHDASLAARESAGRDWIEASRSFEEMLGRALPLIADRSVDERTVQALGTALAAAERAIAEFAPLALGRRAPL